MELKRYDKLELQNEESNAFLLYFEVHTFVICLHPQKETKIF